MIVIKFLLGAGLLGLCAIFLYEFIKKLWKMEDK